MIAFEEFKEQYCETIEYHLKVAGFEDQPQIILDYIDGEEDSKEVVLEKSKNYSTVIVSTFSLKGAHFTISCAVKVGKKDPLTPRLQASVQELLKAPENKVVKELNVKGKMISVEFKYVVPKIPYLMYSIVLQAQGLPVLATTLFKSRNPFLRILKRKQGFNSFVQIHESEVVRNETSPAFKPIKMSSKRLCGGRSCLKLRKHERRCDHPSVGLRRERFPFSDRRTKSFSCKVG